MSLEEVSLEGTLKPDGTLDLDEKPALRPGRVVVRLRQASNEAPPSETWWQFLQRSRHDLEVSGARFMNDDEMQDRIDWLRQGDHIDELLSRTNDDRLTSEQS